jgi:hypothetical protein
MMKSRFTESQIVAILKERKAGVAPSDPTRKLTRTYATGKEDYGQLQA